MKSINSCLRTLWFILAGGLGLAQGLHSEVKVENLPGSLEITVGGKPVLQYHTAVVPPPPRVDPVYARSGFIHPLFSPSGKILTDPFPVGHVHQHAVFSAWSRATFRHQTVDFWNQDDKLGNVEHRAVVARQDNGFTAHLQQVSIEHGPALDEIWKVSVEESRDPFIIDLETEQRCATTDEVYLHHYRYGGMAFRGSKHWSEEDKDYFEGPMKILTGEGIRDREAGNHSTPRWVAAYGPVEGQTVGVVYMDHPGNFRHPQAVRIHPTMPYFVFGPVPRGSVIIRPGMAYQARYRIITFDGEPDAEVIEGWYRSFAKGRWRAQREE